MTDSIHLVTNSTLPHYWSINGVTVLAGIMEKMGVDAATLLAESGIHPHDLGNPDVFITPEQDLLIRRKIPTLSDDPRIGLIIGQQYHIGVHGKLGSAALCSDTGLDAISLVLQHSFLATSYFQYNLKVKDNLIFVKMRELTNLDGIRAFICESEFISVRRICSDALGVPLIFNEVRLAYPKPTYASAYQDFFQCPVHFNAPEHRMVVDSKFLFRKLPMSNTMARKTYQKECEQICLRLKAQETVTGQVRDKIVIQSDRLPSFSQLARSMNMSPCTLRRRLKDEGTSFKNLATEILRKKAMEMIQTTSYPMEQIASELGYSDTANFYRAFKGWTGHSPGYYRKNH